jgi:hypothetical protein
MENIYSPTLKDLENLNKIQTFLESENIAYEYDIITDEVISGIGNKISIYEPTFYLNGRTLEVRYINSFTHKIDYSKRFGDIQDGIPKNYFAKLSQKNKDNGIRTIFIKDYEIEECSDIIDNITMEPIKDYHRKWEVLKSYILTATGNIKNRIYARDCEVKIVPSKAPNNQCKRFLEQYCFYGNRNANINLGLYLKKDKCGFKAGTLLFMTTFGMNFYGNKGKAEPNIEVIRVATITETQVIGGASKVLKYFFENYPTIKLDGKKIDIPVNRVVFYVDACHNSANSMDTLGYKFVSWDSTGGFHNFAAKEINIPELKVQEGRVFQRKPMIHKKIMELMGSGHIVSIGTAGTIVYELYRDEVMKEKEIE